MSGDDAVDLLVIQALQYPLGDSTPQGGVGTGTEFIDEHQGAVVGCLDELPGVFQAAGVGTEVILDTLLVADVGEHPLEYAKLGFLIYRY